MASAKGGRIEGYGEGVSPPAVGLVFFVY